MKTLASLLCLAFLTPSFTAFGAASLDDVLSGYRDVSGALAKDNFGDASAKAAKLLVLAQDLAQVAGPLAPHYKKVADGARAMAAATKEADVRATMSVLSEGAVWLVKSTPAIQAKWQLFKCPMVGGGAFPFWMQLTTDPMANPYMGQEMLQCGVKRAWNKFPS